MSQESKNRPAGIESLRAEVNGRRVHYLKAGKGAPVVLVHGGASGADEWTRTMLRGGGRYSFYAPDLPGFGESDRDEKGYYLDDFSDFLAGFIDCLGLEKPALVGHSFGARICLDTVGRPDCRASKLVLVDASGLGKMSPFGGVLFYFFKGLRAVMGQPQPFPRFLSSEGTDWDYVGDAALKNIRIPTLLIWKRTDPYVSISLARRAARMIPGAELAVIGGYGHAPHQQNDNEPFNRLLLDFLDRGGGAGI